VVTARSETGAKCVEEQFVELAKWIKQAKAPVSDFFAEYIVPKIETGPAGSLQFEQGSNASAWFKDRIKQRLKKPKGRNRNLFVRTADSPFDLYHRLLDYVAPSYSKKELETMTRRERATFNLDLVEGGWAVPFTTPFSQRLTVA
jgi:hypothetical protein